MHQVTRKYTEKQLLKCQQHINTSMMQKESKQVMKRALLKKASVNRDAKKGLKQVAVANALHFCIPTTHFDV